MINTKIYFGIDTNYQQVFYSNISDFLQLDTKMIDISLYHLDFIGKIQLLDNPKENDNSIYFYSILNSNIDDLLYLELACNKLPYHFIDKLALFIINTKHLLHLDISSSMIDDIGISILFDAIIKNKSLIKLDISNISINSNTASHLSKLLEYQTTILYYNLYNTFLSIDAFAICFDKLMISPFIHTLLLGNNKIDDKHLPLLLNSLSNNKKLQFLDLISNNLSNQSIDTIKNWLIPIQLTFDTLFDGIYLTKANRISHFDITNNYLDSHSLPSIFNIIDNNIHLNIFGLDYDLSNNILLDKLTYNKKCIDIIQSLVPYPAIIIALYSKLSIDILEKLLFAINYLEILNLKSTIYHIKEK